MKQSTVLYNGKLISISDLCRLAHASETAYKALTKPTIDSNMDLCYKVLKMYKEELIKQNLDPVYIETINDVIEEVESLSFIIKQIALEVK